MDFSTFLLQLYNLDIFYLFSVYLFVALVVPSFWTSLTKPLDMKLVLCCYNILCSAMNLVAAVGMAAGMLTAHSILSNTVTPALIPYFKLYANLKILELLDTVFMILRHRTRQISFLHVFHHSTMLILIHYGLQYTPWTALAPALMLNSIVHIFMHLYYAYTAYFSSSSKPSWKRRITELQIAQFLIDLIYCIVGISQGKLCIWSFFYGLSMLILFTNFYLRAYILRPTTSPNGSKARMSSVNHDSAAGSTDESKKNE
ncbi:very long chain fatty acid elongase 4-like [Watersipora subatra]|uniref:very long chain fatty acid elongase 4-like n=1 Tax=Watersipora subatra TaxID=2589382 RepID=UPI00355C1459